MLHITKMTIKSGILLLCIMMLGIFGWTAYRSTNPVLPDAGGEILLYSNQASDDLRDILVSALKKAECSVHICSFSFTDKAITKTLNELCHRGVEVTIVYDPSTSTRCEYYLDSKIKIVRRQPYNGLMHRKIVVIDSKEIWLGSANLTQESLTVHDNLIQGFYSPEMAKAIVQTINNFVSNTITPLPKSQTYNIASQQAELWLLPEEQKAQQNIVDIIRKAKKNIKIAMFTWTNYTLADAIIDAHNRGVHIEIVVDRYSGRGVSNKICNKLNNAGIVVRLNQGSELLHYKFAYIDDNLLINGSTNWTKAAFSCNDESFMVIPQMTPQQKKFMNTLWQRIFIYSQDL